MRQSIKQLSCYNLAMPPEDQQKRIEHHYRQEILGLPRTTASQFFEFVRERGVAGFAVGFILGGAVGKVAQALTDDIINPAVGTFLGPVKNLAAYAINDFKIGDFLSTLINFLIVCFVMFLIFK